MNSIKISGKSLVEDFNLNKRKRVLSFEVTNEGDRTLVDPIDMTYQQFIHNLDLVASQDVPENYEQSEGTLGLQHVIENMSLYPEVLFQKYCKSIMKWVIRSLSRQNHRMAEKEFEDIFAFYFDHPEVQRTGEPRVFNLNDDDLAKLLVNPYKKNEPGESSRGIRKILIRGHRKLQIQDTTPPRFFPLEDILEKHPGA